MKAAIFSVVILLVMQAFVSHAAEQVSFSSSSTYYGKDVSLTGALRVPDKEGAAPVVILLHGCGGLKIKPVSESLHSHADLLHENGFATLVLDSFTPRQIGPDWVCKKISRLNSAQGYRQRDIVDAIRYFETRSDIDTQNVFVMGQSNGGSVASLMTYRDMAKHIRAAVAYYPWCGAVPYDPITPLLVLTGEKDDWTPPAECLTREAGSDNLTVVNYPNATHSFDLPIPAVVFLGHKLEGNPQATQDSQNRMIEFFKANTR